MRAGLSRAGACAARVVLLGALAVGAAGCAVPESVVRDLDRQQQKISQGLGAAVDRVDRVFGEPRVEDRERIARAKLGYRAEWRENEDASYTFPLSLRLPLPALERSTNIFLEFDSVADASGDLDQAGRTLDDNKVFSATFLKRWGGRVDTGVRLGLYWADGPQAGLRPFVRWEGEQGPVELRLEQQLYWLTDLKLGLLSIAKLDRALDEQSFLRLVTTLEANQETEGVDVEHAVLYRRSLVPEKLVVSAELGVAYNPYDGDPESGEEGAAADDDEGYAQLRLIGKVFRPWIEYEIIPGVYHPWRHEDRLEYGISIAIRLLAEQALSGPEP